MADTEIKLRFKVSDDGSVTLDKIGKNFDQITKSTQSMQNSLNLIKFDSIVNLGERALNAGKQIYSLMENTASLGSELQRNARAMGMTTDEYQQWTYIAKSADVEMEQFLLGVRNLTNVLSDTPDKIEKLGISVKNTNGGFKTIDQLLPEIVKKLSQSSDVTEQNATAMDLFGSRAGLAFANLVREGKSIDEIKKRFQDLGLVISSETVEKLAKSEQSFKDFGFTLTKFKAEILAPLVESFGTLLNKILELKTATEKGIELNLKFTPTISEAEQKVEDFYLMTAGYGTEKAAKASRAAGLGNLETLSAKELYGLGMPETKTTGEGEKKDLFGMTEADHARSKANLEWAIEYQTEFISNLSTIGSLEEQQAAYDYSGQMITGIIEETKTLKEAEEAAKDLGAAWDYSGTMATGAIESQKRSTEELKKEWEELSKHADLVKQFQDQMSSVKTDTNEFISSFSSGLSSAWSTNLTNMIKGTKSFSDSMKNMFSSIADSAISSLAKIAVNLALFGNAKGDTSKGGGGIGGILKLVSSVAGLFSSAGSYSSMGWAGGADYSSFGYQSGGYAKTPQIASLAEHEPEYIIPESKMKQGGDTYITLIEATDVNSFEKKYGVVIDSRISGGKRFNRVSTRG